MTLNDAKTRYHYVATFSVLHGRSVRMTVDRDGTEVIWSYDTPVGYYVDGRGFVTTTKKYSKTTSRHVRQWLRFHGSDRPSSEETPEEIEQFVSSINF